MKTKFEGVTVFIINIKSFNRGAAVTIPGVGIFVGKKHSQNIDLLRHEFGHMLQFRQNGFFIFGSKLLLPVYEVHFLARKRKTISTCTHGRNILRINYRTNTSIDLTTGILETFLLLVIDDLVAEKLF